MSIVIGEKKDYKKNTLNKIKDKIKYFMYTKEKCKLSEEDFIGNIQIIGSAGTGKSMLSFNILEEEIGLYKQLAILNDYEAKIFVSSLKEELKNKIKVIFYKNKETIQRVINELQKENKELIILIFNGNIGSLHYTFEKEIKELIDEIEKYKKDSLLKIYLLKDQVSKSFVNSINQILLKSRHKNISYIISGFDLLDLNLFKTQIILKNYNEEDIYELNSHIKKNKEKINIRDVVSLNPGEFILIKNYNEINYLENKYFINKMYFKNRYISENFSLENFNLKQKVKDF